MMIKTVIKSICYRIYATIISGIVAFVITGDMRIALTISLVDNLIKLITYFIFDICWGKYVDEEIQPCVILLTGLSGAGKTTIANQLSAELAKINRSSILLDGDDIRHIIKLDKFDEQSRKDHNLHVGYMASLFERQGNVVIISMISPYRDIRDQMRNICNRFIEVHVSTPINACIDRDTKGLYKKALAGELDNLTGFNAPYESPISPEVVIDTTRLSLSASVKLIIKEL